GDERLVVAHELDRLDRDAAPRELARDPARVRVRLRAGEELVPDRDQDRPHVCAHAVFAAATRERDARRAPRIPNSYSAIIGTAMQTCEKTSGPGVSSAASAKAPITK